MLPLAVPGTKLVPVTVSVVAAEPPAMVLGLSEVMDGATTVILEAADAAPPGLFTVTLRLPTEARALKGAVAVIEVAVPAVTVKAVEPIYAVDPAVNVLPLVVPATKFVPVILSVVALEPAAMVLGLSDEIVGPDMVSVEADEVAPLGFCTVTLREPVVAKTLLGTVAVMEVAVPAVRVKPVEPI